MAWKIAATSVTPSLKKQMNLKTAIITLLASVVMGGTQYSNPDKNATHKKCIKGREPQPPQYQLECLNRHNELRRKLRTQEGPIQDLQWSDELAKKAQEWANQLAEEDRMYHNPSHILGENLYASWGYNNKNRNCTYVTDHWYAERPNYPDGPGKFGHYTQVVWPTSVYLGCATATGKKNFWVCNYWPGQSYKKWEFYDK